MFSVLLCWILIQMCRWRRNDEQLISGSSQEMQPLEQETIEEREKEESNDTVRTKTNTQTEETNEDNYPHTISQSRL